MIQRKSCTELGSGTWAVSLLCIFTIFRTILQNIWVHESFSKVPHGAECDNGKADFLLFSALVILFMGSPILGWQEQLMGSHILQEFSSAAVALHPCCVQWTQKSTQWGFWCFLLSLPLMPRCSARYFFILLSTVFSPSAAGPCL